MQINLKILQYVINKKAVLLQANRAMPLQITNPFQKVTEKLIANYIVKLFLLRPIV